MKRIFIYSARSLFSQGIKTLLDAQPELEVIGWETTLEEASQRVQQLQPDAILLVKKGSLSPGLSEGEHLLRASGRATIVELNLEDNNVCVYSGEQLAIHEIGDLVRVIEGSAGVVPKRSDSR